VYVEVMTLRKKFVPGVGSYKTDEIKTWDRVTTCAPLAVRKRF